MKKYLSENKHMIIVGIVVAIIVPFIFAIVIDLIMRIPYKSTWNNAEWASFLGSYIGGVATLAAVVISISYSRYEQRERYETERTQRIYKRATIIYYDFQYAFTDILAFFKMYSLSMFMQMFTENVDDKNTNVGDMCKTVFTQLHIDPQWIQNVAELCEGEGFSTDDIQLIYRTYGALSTVQQWLSDKSINSSTAGIAFLSIVQFKDNSVMEVELKPEVVAILNKLKTTARIKDTGQKKEEGPKNG